MPLEAKKGQLKGSLGDQVAPMGGPRATMGGEGAPLGGKGAAREKLWAAKGQLRSENIVVLRFKGSCSSMVVCEHTYAGNDLILVCPIRLAGQANFTREWLYMLTRRGRLVTRT